MKKGRIRYWILFFILLYFLAACSKQEIGEHKYSFDRYTMVVDWYTLDTTFIKTAYIQVFDSVWKPETKLAFDTAYQIWYIDCNMLDVLQHLYYTKNGKIINNKKS